MVNDDTKAELVRKYLLGFYESFTVESNYRFLQDCEHALGRGHTEADLNELMDTLATLAHTFDFRQEYRIMAKAQAASSKSTTAATVKATPAKAASEAKQAPPPREPKIPGASRITWNTKENPKRAGTKAHERWEAYVGAKTVDAYLEAGGTRADLSWDLGREYISIE